MSGSDHENASIIVYGGAHSGSDRLARCLLGETMDRILFLDTKYYTASAVLAVALDSTEVIQKQWEAIILVFDLSRYCSKLELVTKRHFMCPLNQHSMMCFSQGILA